MHFPRRVNDLDNFLSQNQVSNAQNRMHSPRHPPLQNLLNQYQSAHPLDQKNVDKGTERNISPNKLNATRKPMISPARTSRIQAQERVALTNNNVSRNKTNRETYCSNANHQNKKAAYIIHIDDEDMYFCGVCATQAASQGFHVSKIGEKKGRVLPNHTEYQNNRRYQEIIELMRQILKVEEQYKQRDPKNVREHYSSQSVLVGEYYDELIEVIVKMKDEHLESIEMQSSKNMQIMEMQYDHLRINLQQSNEIWEDIQQNLRVIIEQIDQNSFKDCMKKYKNSLLIFNHKIEESGDFIKSFTNYQILDLQRKIKRFEFFLKELKDNREEKEILSKKANTDQNNFKRNGLGLTNERFEKTVKNMHQNLPKSNLQQNCEGQNAFRSLFPEEEGRMVQASPQFKAF